MDGMKEKVKEALKDNWYSGKSIDESADAILSLFEKKCVWKFEKGWLAPSCKEVSKYQKISAWAMKHFGFTNCPYCGGVIQIEGENNG